MNNIYMYKYTNIVNNKNVDLFIVLICSNFKKNIEGLEKKFKIKFPKKFIDYFKDKKRKYLKQMVGNKLFIISKVNNEKIRSNNTDCNHRDHHCICLFWSYFDKACCRN